MKRYTVRFKQAGELVSALIEANNESEAGRSFSKQYQNVRPDDVISVTLAVEDMSWLVFSRHMVGVSILVAVATFISHTRIFTETDRGLEYLANVFAAIGIPSALICGLAALFFTENQRGQMRRNFVRCVWVLSVIIVLGTLPE